MPSLHFVANYKCLKSSTLRWKVELFANLCIDIVSKAFSSEIRKALTILTVWISTISFSRRRLSQNLRRLKKEHNYSLNWTRFANADRNFRWTFRKPARAVVRRSLPVKDLSVPILRGTCKRTPQASAQSDRQSPKGLVRAADRRVATKGGFTSPAVLGNCLRNAKFNGGAEIVMRSFATT